MKEIDKIKRLDLHERSCSVNDPTSFPCDCDANSVVQQILAHLRKRCADRTTKVYTYWLRDNILRLSLLSESILRKLKV